MNKKRIGLCITTYPCEIKENKLREIIENLKIGVIDKIRIIKHKRYDSYSAFIYLDISKSSYPLNMYILNRLIHQKEEIYIIYDFPKYFKCSLIKE